MCRIHLPSPGLAVAVVALVIAGGGTSYAISSLPKNSVGTRQLKNRAVTTAKLSSSASARIAGLTYKKVMVDIPAHMAGAIPVACPAGLAPIGGGLETPKIADAPYIIDSHPISAGWQVSAGNPSSAKQTISAYAVCAKAASGTPAISSAAARSGFRSYAPRR